MFSWGVFPPARLESKGEGMKLMVPIRPIALTSGVMDLNNVVVRMV